MILARIFAATMVCTMSMAGADGAPAMTARFSAGDGRQMAVFSDGDTSIPGKLNGPYTVDGAALVLNGRAQAVFPYSILADVASGELSFRVKLNFDPDTDPRAKGDLKNQFFFSIVQGKKQFIIYTYFVNLSFLIQDENGKIEIVKTIPTSWVKDEWRTVKLRWGREIELLVDTDRVAADGTGLFSPRPDASPPEIIIGSQSTVSGIASAFTIDSIYMRRTPLASHERERFEDHFRTSRQLIGYPAYPLSASDRSMRNSIADVRRNYRMRSWAFPTNVSADDAESMVRLVK